MDVLRTPMWQMDWKASGVVLGECGTMGALVGSPMVVACTRIDSASRGRILLPYR